MPDNRIFFDTEFIDDGATIDLISIALVKENGEHLYRISADFDETHASEWIKAHVLPHLKREDRYARDLIADEIQRFCGNSPEFWGYYCDYDWVAMCQLYGTMMQLPKGWPMYCHDLRQALDARGLQKIKQADNAPHIALSDALWIFNQWHANCKDA